MKYILLALAMALIAVITSCGHWSNDLPSGDTGTDTVGIEEDADIDTTVKDTTDTEDTTAEVTTVSESTESSDMYETTAETTVDADEIIAVYDSISLLFEPCELPHEVLDESDIDTTYNYSNNQYLYTITDSEANVLGCQVNVKTVGFRLKSTDRVYTYSTCTDKENGEIFFQGFNILFSDIDRDGSLEAIKDNRLYMNKYGEILAADLKSPFERYIQRKHPLVTDYKCSIRFEKEEDYAIFYYRVNYDSDNYYESHELQAFYKDNSYFFVYNRSATINPNAQFVSNDPDWRVDIAYTDVNEYFVNRNGLYTINICGPNGEVFPFYDSEGTKPLDKSYWDRGLGIGIDESTEFDRKLIVHPNYSYAVLIYPYCTQTCDEIQGSCEILMDLKNGDFAFDYPSEVIDLYRTFDKPTEIISLDGVPALHIYDFQGINTCRCSIGVDITEKSFIITTYVREANGDVLYKEVKRVDLENLDLSGKK